MGSRRGPTGRPRRPDKKDGGGAATSGAGNRRTPNDPGGDPIDFLIAAHVAQLKLCDRLEAIADSLPGNVDRTACHRAALALRHDVHLHHLDEEEGLFPLLRHHAADDAKLNESISRLETEHASDEGFSDELIELLERLARGEKPLDQEAAGYMLRGFFESFRRHLAFENEVILPRARALLSDDDRETLSQAIRRNRLEAPRILFPKDIDGRGPAS